VLRQPSRSKLGITKRKITTGTGPQVVKPLQTSKLMAREERKIIHLDSTVEEQEVPHSNARKDQM